MPYLSMYSGLKKYTIRGLSFCRVGQFNLGKWSRSKQGNISASGTPHANSSLNINYYLSKRSSKISRARREKKVALHVHQQINNRT